jgi:hypothetical protein
MNVMCAITIEQVKAVCQVKGQKTFGGKSSWKNTTKAN